VLSGHGKNVTGGRSYRIGGGDVFVIAGERAHEYRDMRELVLYNVLFRPEVLLPHNRLLRRTPGYRALFVLEPRYRVAHGFRGRMKLGAEALTEATRLIVRMEREQERHVDGYEAMAASLLQQLVVMLSREYARVRRGVPRSLSRLADVIDYLERNYDQRIALPDLAERAHMSVNNFLRVFKDAVGESPIKHQIRIRCMRGGELLRAGSTVTETAYEVGFSDGNYFSRQFSKVMGMSPRAWAARED